MVRWNVNVQFTLGHYSMKNSLLIFSILLMTRWPWPADFSWSKVQSKWKKFKSFLLLGFEDTLVDRISAEQSLHCILIVCDMNADKIYLKIDKNWNRSNEIRSLNYSEPL